VVVPAKFGPPQISVQKLRQNKNLRFLAAFIAIKDQRKITNPSWEASGFCISLAGYKGCLPFTRANRSVYRLGRFGQMVSKFPYWENSVRDWRLPFAEIPTIYQKKICTTATANEKVAKQKLWLKKQRLCTYVIFGIFLCRSVHNYNMKWPNSTFCVERKYTTVNFRFYNNNNNIIVITLFTCQVI